MNKLILTIGAILSTSLYASPFTDCNEASKLIANYTLENSIRICSKAQQGFSDCYNAYTKKVNNNKEVAVKECIQASFNYADCFNAALKIYTSEKAHNACK